MSSSFSPLSRATRAVSAAASRSRCASCCWSVSTLSRSLRATSSRSEAACSSRSRSASSRRFLSSSSPEAGVAAVVVLVMWSPGPRAVTNIR